MKKFRKLLSAALALAMVFSLAACGGDPAGDSSNPPSGSTQQPANNGGSDNQNTNEPSGGAVTLNWAIWDKDSTAYWQALADEYMKTHEGVTIEMTDLGSTDYMTQLAAQLSGGNGELDVLSIKDIPGYANLINLEMLEPLNDALTTPQADFGGVLEQLTAEDGKFYGIPFRADFWVVFYNKDLFDAAGVDYPSNDMTLDECDALIRQMTSGSGAEKVYGGHYHTWRSAVSLFGILDGKQTIVDGSYDFLKPIYERVLKEQEDGVVMDFGELKTSGLHYSAAFQNGTAAMVNMGSWFLATMQQYNANAASEGAAVMATAAIYLEMPLSDKASEIETVLNTEHDAIMTGAETVDEGIANMNEQVQAILNG